MTSMTWSIAEYFGSSIQSIFRSLVSRWWSIVSFITPPWRILPNPAHSNLLYSSTALKRCYKEKIFPFWWSNYSRSASMVLTLEQSHPLFYLPFSLFGALVLEALALAIIISFAISLYPNLNGPLCSTNLTYSLTIWITMENSINP